MSTNNSSEPSVDKTNHLERDTDTNKTNEANEKEDAIDKTLYLVWDKVKIDIQHAAKKSGQKPTDKEMETSPNHPNDITNVGSTEKETRLSKKLNKLSKTIDSYRLQQDKYLKWAETTHQIQGIHRLLVTPRRVLNYLTQEHFGNSSNTSQIKIGVMKFTITAMEDLYSMQYDKVSRISKRYPDLQENEEPCYFTWPEEMRTDYIKQYFAGVRSFNRKLLRVANAKRDRDGDPFYESYPIKKLEKISRKMLKTNQFNLWFSMIGCHSLMLTGESMRSLNLSDVIVQKLEETQSGPAMVLYFVIKHSEMNGTGKVEYVGSLRHKNPHLCSHLALALSFFDYFHNECSPVVKGPIDFSSPQLWYWIKLFRGDDNTSSLTEEKHKSMVQKVLESNGMEDKRITEVFRGTSARYCLDNGVPESLVRLFGHWGNDDITQSDLTTVVVPKAPMYVLSGSDSTKPCNIKRQKLDPPESVCNRIFPFINKYLEAIKNDTLADLLFPNIENNLQENSPELSEILLRQADLNSKIVITTTIPNNVNSSDGTSLDTEIHMEDTGSPEKEQNEEGSKNESHLVFEDELGRDSQPPPEQPGSSGINRSQRSLEDDVLKVRDAVMVLDYLRKVLVQDLLYIGDYAESIMKNRIFDQDDYKAFQEHQINPYRIQQRLPEPPRPISQQQNQSSYNNSSTPTIEMINRLNESVISLNNSLCNMIPRMNNRISTLYDKFQEAENRNRANNTAFFEMVNDIQESVNSIQRMVYNEPSATAATAATAAAVAQSPAPREPDTEYRSIHQVENRPQQSLEIPTASEEQPAPGTGFTPQKCNTIQELYDDYLRLKPQLAGLKDKFSSLKSIPQYRSFQRRNAINRIIMRFLVKDFTLENAIEILQSDMEEKGISINQYCDLKKDDLIERYHL